MADEFTQVLTTEAADFPNAQDGYVTAVPVWDDTDTILETHSPAGGFRTAFFGFVFDLELALSGDGDIVLEPPIITLGSLALDPDSSDVGGAISTIDVRIVPEHAPAAFSDTLRPGTRSEVVIGSSAGVNTVTFPSSDAGAADPDGQVLSRRNTLLQYTRDARWNGRLTLACLVTSVDNGNNKTYTSSEGAPAGGTTPTLTLTLWPFHTGHFIGNRRGRARHDDRRGFPAASDELIADGFSPGTAVFSFDWDEPDHPDRYRPSPKEGSLDPEP